MYAVASASVNPVASISERQRPPSSEVRREQVGQAELRREDLTLIEGGRIMVLAQALGPPRLWGYLLDTALDAFTDGYLRATEGSIAVRLNHGIRTASHFVRTRVDALIERRGADVGILAIAFDGPSLHVLGAGTLDAYLYRRKSLRCLSLDEQAEGLFKSNASYRVEHVEPADMLFAGSRAICGPALLSRLNIALDNDRSLSPQAIVDTLTGTASELGQGCASLALRVAATF